jgi:hypothetical protein
LKYQEEGYGVAPKDFSKPGWEIMKKKDVLEHLNDVHNLLGWYKNWATVKFDGGVIDGEKYAYEMYAPGKFTWPVDDVLVWNP